MSIEQDLGFRVKQSEERYADTELVDNEDIWIDVFELLGEEAYAGNESELS